MARSANAREPPTVSPSNQAWYRDRGWKAERRYSARNPDQHLQASGSREGTIVKYLVVIEKGPRSFGAHVPDLPGCIAAARTRGEVVKLIREAIEFHIEGLKASGAKVPLPHSEGKIV